MKLLLQLSNIQLLFLLGIYLVLIITIVFYKLYKWSKNE
jgi:hypothetical protein